MTGEFHGRSEGVADILEVIEIDIVTSMTSKEDKLAPVLLEELIEATLMEKPLKIQIVAHVALSHIHLVMVDTSYQQD